MKSCKSSFVSLEKELEGWFDKSFDELPENLRNSVERAFRPSPWDNQKPKARRKRANHWDCLHNPAIQKEQKRLWPHVVHIAEIEENIQKWELVPYGDANGLELKQKTIVELKSELLKAEAEFSRAAGSAKRARNAELQDAAKSLAEQWKKEGCKHFTKRQIAEALSKSEEWKHVSKSRIERLICKKW